VQPTARNTMPTHVEPVSLGGSPHCPVSSGARIALLLRGQAFRGPGADLDPSKMGLGGPAGLVAHVVGCSPYADGDEQHEATQSLLDHIIKPLEQECHNTVDVVLTECSAPHGCPRLQQVFQQLGGRVVANRTACTIRDQGEGYRAALSLFKSRMRFASYEIVLVTRHDVVWSRPITQWRSTNFSRVNFLGGCEPSCKDLNLGRPRCDEKHEGTPSGGPPSKCVQDVLHTVPRRSFRGFDMAIGRRGCFQGEGSKVSGHACFGVMEARTGPTGLVLPLDEWRPYKDVREPNPVCHLLAPASVRGGERGLVKTYNGGAAKSHGNNRTKSGGSAERFCHIAPELRAQMPVALVRRLCGGSYLVSSKANRTGTGAKSSIRPAPGRRPSGAQRGNAA